MGPIVIIVGLAVAGFVYLRSRNTTPAPTDSGASNFVANAPTYPDGTLVDTALGTLATSGRTFVVPPTAPGPIITRWHGQPPVNVMPPPGAPPAVPSSPPPGAPPAVPDAPPPGAPPIVPDVPSFRGSPPLTSTAISYPPIARKRVW